MRASIWILWVLVAACAGASKPEASVREGSATRSQAAISEVPMAPVVAIPSAKQPLAGVLTGGAPSGESLRQAKAAGYHTVISLLPEADSPGEASAVSELGLQFVSIPVASPDDLTVDNAQRLGQALQDENKPLILHCASGNRAGALLALWAFHVDGRSAEQSLSLGVSAGLAGLRPEVEKRLGMAPSATKSP